MKNKIYIAFCVLCCLYACTSEQKMNLKSPDKALSADFFIEDGKLWYQVSLDEKVVIEKSPLGIILETDDFTQNLTYVESSGTKSEKLHYDLPMGKKSEVNKEYTERTILVKNEKGNKTGIVCRAFNDGIAFAYQLQGSGKAVVLYENTGFKLHPESNAFISPLAKAKSGWAKTNPSYEDQYQRDIQVGTPSDYGQGWVFPALFKTNNNDWILISETGVDRNYVGSHLADDSSGGLYKIEFPHTDHNLPGQPSSAEVSLPFTTPWRTITVGNSLGKIVESTMAQDLVSPVYKSGHTFNPGKAAWSWLVYGDSHTTFNDTKDFIDMASDLKFTYCLIDAVWDTQIGREKVEELAGYAKSKNVDLILWYNSNGNWNDAPQTPINLMNEKEVRRKEMAWLQQIGVKGIKVDFFGGDKQAGMQLYQDILEDANEFGIGCNFHGCTLPRGWDRMFPNFMTAEAVMGMEFCMFNQQNADFQPAHCATLPFTRNVVAPMDFTPVVFNSQMGHGGTTVRRTSLAFELALPVLFYSSIQHFGIVPDNLNSFPEFVWKYLSDVPTTWDETVFIDGYPGKEVIMARRTGNNWYVAGINGENKQKNLSFSLPFIKENNTKAVLIEDKNKHRNEVQQTDISISKDRLVEISTEKFGGFILIIEN